MDICEFVFKYFSLSDLKFVFDKNEHLIFMCIHEEQDTMIYLKVLSITSD
jgi:hypothetical protein